MKTEDRALKRLIIFALISVTVAVLTAIGVFCYFFVDLDGEREIIEIPDFVGRRIDEIGTFQNIKIESEPIFSEEVPEGEIISQFPYGGAKRKIAEGERYTVSLTVSMGKETRDIPSLHNFKYADAAIALRAIGAKIRIVSVYDDEKEGGLVLRTSPKAGESIERGDLVTLFVSRNHVLRPIRVKDFVGMQIESATAEILAQGLNLGDLAREYFEGRIEGEVISQSIAQGSIVPYGSRIDIVVSGGQEKEELHPFRGNITEENGEINGND